MGKEKSFGLDDGRMFSLYIYTRVVCVCVCVCYIYKTSYVVTHSCTYTWVNRVNLIKLHFIYECKHHKSFVIEANKNKA
jgi:hypothetical protein